MHRLTQHTRGKLWYVLAGFMMIHWEKFNPNVDLHADGRVKTTVSLQYADDDARY